MGLSFFLWMLCTFDTPISSLVIMSVGYFLLGVLRLIPVIPIAFCLIRGLIHSVF